MGPLVTGGGNTGAASVTTNFIPYYLDKKYRREDTPVLCRGGFSRRLRRLEIPPLQRRRIIRSRVSLLDHSNYFFAFHNRGWTSANTFETAPIRPSTTDTCILLVHSTYPTRGYEVTSPISYRNVGFFLSPLLRTSSESATTQTPMPFYAVGSGVKICSLY